MNLEGRLRHALRSGVVQDTAGKTEGLIVGLTLFRVKLEQAEAAVLLAVLRHRELLRAAGKARKSAELAHGRLRRVLDLLGVLGRDIMLGLDVAVRHDEQVALGHALARLLLRSRVA